MKIKGFAFCFFGMATGDMINLSSPRELVVTKGNRPGKLWFNRKGVKEFLREGSRWAEFKGEHKTRNLSIMRF